MNESIIKQASNNKERQNTYRYQLGRYNRAFRAGFYFEAMMIVYSMLEDRLKSMLYYCGVLRDRNTLKVNKKIRIDILDIYSQYDANSKIYLSKIGGKIDLLKAIMNWSVEVNSSDIQGNTFLLALKALMTDIDVGGLLDTFEQMDSWLKYRNEVMHAAMNKNVEALYEDLNIRVEEGMECARFIDSQVKLMKKTNRVRKIFKI